MDNGARMGGPAESTSLASKARGIGERFPLHQLRRGTVALIQAAAEGTASPPGYRTGVSQVGTDTEPLDIEGGLLMCSPDLMTRQDLLVFCSLACFPIQILGLSF